jgi:2-keto-4-pentenoate hydratase/2-oxohepta-3-ene-1,7-dioic acid hydratase in catechol pathway
MKIIAIGRNYINHAKELNNEVPAEPVFFMKPETALLQKNQPFYYPEFSENIHYEVELVIKINRVGKHIPKEFAHRYYNEIALGIDFTARDLQKDAKEKGLPWEKAKAFDHSAPLSKFFDKSDYKSINNINFSLTKNGETVQRGNSSDMIFPVDNLIAFVSQFVTLKIGDLIFTGTPEGVGAVQVGDKLIASLEDQEVLSVDIL